MIVMLFDYFTLGITGDLNCKLLNRLLLNKKTKIQLPRHNHIFDRLLESVPDCESVSLLERLSSLSDEKMWNKLLEINLGEIVEFLDEAWAPDTYQAVLGTL